MRASGDRTTRPVAAVTTTGGVLVRGLVHRLAARGEPMPVQHALAIVVSAASRVHAAHIAGSRLICTLDTVLVKFDGTVEIEAPTGAAVADVGIARSDVVALGALLAELVRGAAIPDGLAEAFSTAIDVEAGPDSAGELAQALAFAAKAAKIPLSRGDLGRWARRQVHPPRLAHTLRRDSVPELGVDLGAVKPKPKKGAKAEHPKLALGSGTFEELLPDDPGPDGDSTGDVDVDLDDLIEATVTPPAMAAVTLPVPPELVARPQSWGTALLALFAVVLILGAAGVLYFYR